ncbi:MAG: hypothetical protein ACRBM6_36705 [Geminicoccales bacterium]
MPPSTSLPSEPSLLQDWIQALRYWLSGRVGVILLASGVVGAGLWLNWGWLVSVGLAPLILSFLPCAAMCALGLCMHGHGGARPSENSSARPDDTDLDR